MKKIRVLFNASSRAFDSPGGGEVLLLKSKQYLQKEGIVIELYKEGKTQLQQFDLFHNFSLHRQCSDAIKAAKQAGLPIAISPIYWPSLRNAIQWNKGIARKAKAISVELINLLDFFSISGVRKMLNMADALLVSSEAEAALFEKRFRINREKISVVHNGVEERFRNAKPLLFEEKFHLKDFVLYAGRIEERKNVLSLIKAMQGIDSKLVVIGDAKKGSEAYLQKCKATAGKQVIFVGAMQHDSALLAAAYAACRVFALPSWYETPGLAALEAGLAGANIVITREGPTREYFGKHAAYVNPASVQDIRGKILLQLHKPKTSALSRHIERNFLWQNTATQTKAAYEKILQKAK